MRFVPTIRRTAYSAAFLFGAACGEGSGPDGSGRLTLLLTDAPGDVAKAVVTISEVYLQGSDGRVVLRSEPVTTDLLTLANSTAELVEETEVPAGTYAQLRFVVSGGYIELEDGSVYASSPDYEGLTEIPAGGPVTGELQMPSLAQSGLKVNLPGDELEISSEQKILLVDFDVAQSFGHAAGQSGRWVMHPVITATEVQLSGSVDVVVVPAEGLSLPSGVAIGDFVAVLERDNGDGTTTTEELALEPVGDAHEAEFRFLAPGSFDVSLRYAGAVPNVTFETSPSMPASLGLASGQTADVTFTLTGVTATP